jgi:oligopeptide/dipeptide ABC transporter ATP-binding protein
LTSSELLKVSDLSVEFRLAGMTINALDHVSLTLPTNGYSLGIVGESGSGKTTLAMSIMDAIEPPGMVTGGQVEFEGTLLLNLKENELRKYRWEKVAMIYQSAMNSLNPVKSVRDPIIEVLREHRHMSKREATDEAERLLSEVGIKKERTRDYPHEFSGGMKQRVVIALALALSPQLLIADEPTSALDVVVQSQILNLLKNEVIQKQRSLVFITHEIAILRGVVEHLALMYAGEIVELGPIEEVLSRPLHPYTEMLLSTLLTLDSTAEMLSHTERGQVERGRDYVRAVGGAVGCKYAGRCKYAFDRCNVERPVLKEAEKGRWVACHKYA